MSPDTPQDDHLAELRRRWEADPGSRLYLQLAEEYRRAGRHGDALEVLQKGLEKYPHQVSALVSLGRVHLESGNPNEAAQALERAVSMDATNLVAMKLAVEAYLQQGDLDQARQRLELYTLLNEGDPEVEELQRRLEGRPAESTEAATPAEMEEEAAPGDEGEPAEMASDELASEPDAPSAGTAWSPTAAWPELPRDAAELVEPAPAAQAETPVPPPPAAGSQTPASRHPEGDPFADLASPDLRRRYMSALGSEGIFPVATDEVEEAAEEEAPAAPMEALAEPAAAREWAEEAAGEDDDELAAVTAVKADEGGQPDEHPTVTLGQLYLDQGHPADAVRIFEAVLARNPDHVQARVGLLRARAAVAAAPAVGEKAGGDLPEAAGETLEELESEIAAADGELPVTAEPRPASVPPPLETDAADRVASAGPPEAGPPTPRPFDLTAAQLLRGVDADDPRRALLHAYLDRLRGPGAAREDRGSDVP
jgi:tetratricopeptide (TPR) repeat protein